MPQYGPRVIGEAAYAAQQAAHVATAGGKYGPRVTGHVEPPPVDHDEESHETQASLSVKKLGVALAEHPESVHEHAAAELAREDGPRKTALLALRAVAEARQADDPQAAALVADLDAALAALLAAD